jgi:hypothetical protein
MLLVALGLAAGCQAPERGPMEIRAFEMLDPRDSAHHMIMDVTSGGVRLAAADGVHVSPVFERDGWQAPLTFDELLLSWNVDVPTDAGFCVEIQVAQGEDWSPWLYIGDWGRALDKSERVTEFEHGKVNIDIFRGTQHFDRARYRVRGLGGDGELVVRLVALSFTDTNFRTPTNQPAWDWFEQPRPLHVPTRSQRTEDEAIAARICSPTSVSMVMEYHGVDVPTAELAADIYDPVHDIYGIWPRAVQAAHTRGVPGYLMRFSSWRDVEAKVAALPIVISIRAREGELQGAPYPSTSGHLLVLCGFDRKGRALVNDPAAPDTESVRRVYAREDLERVWLANGGIAYVFGPPHKP